MLYTSRFSNPELKSGKYTVVGIVRYMPKYPLKYKLAGNIFDIAPTKALFNVYDREEFSPPYKAHLDAVGFGKISEQIRKYAAQGKDVVLCCYEDVRIPNEWCHRLVFAEWWLEKTGEEIPELNDDSPIKIKRNVVGNNPVEVKVAVAVKPTVKPDPKAERWLAGAKTDDSGRYYVVPEISYKNYEAHTNWNPCFYIVTAELKLRRIGLQFAKELVARGQAIEISKADVASLKEK